MDLKGIDYFPFSIDFFDDNKIALIEAEFGSNGVVVLLKIYCKIYRNGFFCEWTPDDCMLFARKMTNGMTPEEVQAIIDKALERNVFDKKSYESFGLLTSIEIQKQFFFIAARRKEIRIEKTACLLIDLSSYKNICFGSQESLKPEKVDNSGSNVDILPENVDSAKQRKGKIKESKGKESKENLSSSSSSACVTQKSCREIFAGYREELLGDEDWQDSVVMMSGKGVAVVQLLPEVMEMFDMHAISMGRIGEIRNRNQYAEHFINWWRCMKFRSATEIETYNQLRNNEVGGEPAAKGFRRYTLPEKKSKVQQAFELSELVSADVKKMMLG